MFLDDDALAFLPYLLKKDYNIEVKGELIRLFLTTTTGRNVKVDIFGKCEKDGEEYTIIGVVKFRLTRKRIDKFITNKIEPFKDQYKNILPIMVTVNIGFPETEEYAKSRGVIFYYSYHIAKLSAGL
ncbi:MAG TPA: hypothetical protein PLD27_00895 [bacterium]|mgnify:CR=1 FL=1|nr:hypothetical protein [bacterium]HOL47200.1 hypothetical protein [bacterium]HPQ17693.1 hypothetical protein [bacterium]